MKDRETVGRESKKTIPCKSHTSPPPANRPGDSGNSSAEVHVRCFSSDESCHTLYSQPESGSGRHLGGSARSCCPQILDVDEGLAKGSSLVIARSFKMARPRPAKATLGAALAAAVLAISACSGMALVTLPGHQVCERQEKADADTNMTQIPD